MRNVITIGGALVVCCLVTSVAPARTWTDRSGRKIEGRLVRLNGDTVVIQRNLQVFQVPIGALSDEDQKYVREKAGDGRAAPEQEKDKSDDLPGAAVAEGGSADSAAEAPVSDAGGEVRTWTDNRGRTIQAQFVDIKGANVELVMDGKPISVPLHNLSHEDRTYAFKQRSERLFANRPGQNSSPLGGGPAAGGNPPAVAPGYPGAGGESFSGAAPGYPGAGIAGGTAPGYAGPGSPGATPGGYPPGGLAGPGYSGPGMGPGGFPAGGAVGSGYPGAGGPAGPTYPGPGAGGPGYSPPGAPESAYPGAGPAGSTYPMEPTGSELAGAGMGAGPGLGAGPPHLGGAAGAPHATEEPSGYGMPAGSSRPPSFTPPTIDVPVPGIPITEYTCSNCNATVSRSATKCPSCGVEFDYTEEPDGTRTYSNSASSFNLSGRGVRGLIKIGILGLIGIASLVGFIVKKVTGHE